MFPESATDGEKIPSTQLVADQPTNLQQLSQPSQMLRTALQNLVNYQVGENMVHEVMVVFSTYSLSSLSLCPLPSALHRATQN